MPTPRKLGFESLEARRVWAGNVTAQVVAGELQIAGDGAANYVDIQQRTIGGVTKFVVTGKDFGGTFTSAGNPIVGGNATTINGSAAPFREVADRVSIHLNGGNDALRFGGSGQTIQVDALEISSGAGSDYVLVQEVKVQMSTLIETTQASSYSFAAETERGDDKLVIKSFTQDDGLVRLATGGGADTINVQLTGRGTGSFMNIFAGGGEDSVSVSNSNVNVLSIDAGDSNSRDVVKMRSTQVTELTVDMGAGNGDLFYVVKDVKIRKLWDLNGGPGKRDEFRKGHNIQAPKPNAVGFEIPKK